MVTTALNLYSLLKMAIGLIVQVQSVYVHNINQYFIFKYFSYLFQLAGYDVRDVKGDGGCYYRCLSAYFTGAEDSYNKYRREVVAYIREHLDNYSSMIKSEIGYASTNDYFSRKMRTDHQEFAETTEIIATCCHYNINIHVLARVPGKGTWEWLHFDPSIGSGKPSTAKRDIYLYNQGSVHFMLCTPK